MVVGREEEEGNGRGRRYGGGERRKSEPGGFSMITSARPNVQQGARGQRKGNSVWALRVSSVEAGKMGRRGRIAGPKWPCVQEKTGGAKRGGQASAHLLFQRRSESKMGTRLRQVGSREAGLESGTGCQFQRVRR